VSPDRLLSLEMRLLAQARQEMAGLETPETLVAEDPPVFHEPDQPEPEPIPAQPDDDPQPDPQVPEDNSGTKTTPREPEPANEDEVADEENTPHQVPEDESGTKTAPPEPQPPIPPAEDRHEASTRDILLTLQKRLKNRNPSLNSPILDKLCARFQ